MFFIVGATGVVGGGVAMALAQEGHKVRGLVRTTSNPARVAEVKAAGVEIVEGDLKDAASIAAGVKGANAVLSAVSAIVSQQPSDSLEGVDLAGNVALVDAATTAGAQRFVFVSFPAQDVRYQLQDAKRGVEKKIQASGLSYAILRPTFFMESWLSPMLGFDALNQKARILGSGDAKHAFIAVKDVIDITKRALLNDAQGIFDLGGPEMLSQRDAVKIFEEVGGKPFTLEEVPESALRAGLEQAKHPVQQAFAGLMLAAAVDDRLDTKPAAAAFPLKNPGTVRSFAQRVLGA